MLQISSIYLPISRFGGGELSFVSHYRERDESTVVGEDGAAFSEYIEVHWASSLTLPLAWYNSWEMEYPRLQQADPYLLRSSRRPAPRPPQQLSKQR